MRNSRIKNILTAVISGVILAVFAVVVIVPVIWFVIASIKPSNLIHTRVPVLRFTPTLENYIKVFTNLRFGKYFYNSLVICGLSTVFAFVPGVFAAYAFARYQSKVLTKLSFWVLSTRMMPPIAVIIPIYLLMSKVGLLDTYFGVILIYGTINLPYVVWMTKSFISEIPPDLDEAALVDGCSRLGVIWRVILPLAAPGMISTGIFVFILCWSEFIFALLLTSMQTKTLPVAIATFITDRGIEWGRMSAAGTALVLPLAIMFYLIQQYLVRGLTFGAIKG